MKPPFIERLGLRENPLLADRRLRRLMNVVMALILLDAAWQVIELHGLREAAAVIPHSPSEWDGEDIGTFLQFERRAFPTPSRISPWVTWEIQTVRALWDAIFALCVAMLWCREKTRADREQISVSLITPRQLLVARSVVWLAPALLLALAHGAMAFHRFAAYQEWAHSFPGQLSGNTLADMATGTASLRLALGGLSEFTGRAAAIGVATLLVLWWPRPWFVAGLIGAGSLGRRILYMAELSETLDIVTQLGWGVSVVLMLWIGQSKAVARGYGMAGASEAPRPRPTWQ